MRRRGDRETAPTEEPKRCNVRSDKQHLRAEEPRIYCTMHSRDRRLIKEVEKKKRRRKKKKKKKKKRQRARAASQSGLVATGRGKGGIRRGSSFLSPRLLRSLSASATCSAALFFFFSFPNFLICY